MAKTGSTYVYEKHFNVSALEYEDETNPLVLVRASSHAVVSCGFDLTPEKAIELGRALIKHGEAMLVAQEVAA